MRKSGSYETSKTCCQQVKKTGIPKSKKNGLPGMCPEGPEGSKTGSVLFPALHGTEKSGTDRVGSRPARNIPVFGTRPKAKGSVRGASNLETMFGG